MKLAIIIPTYREAEAIGAVLDEVMRASAQIPEHAWSVVVVDAASPDGTAAVVRERQRRSPNLYLIEEGEKRGIALAYVAGISYARDVLAADAFMEFDGDGQHDANDLPRLASVLAQGYDCVVGSRYVPGGCVPSDWGLSRTLLSRFGSLYARLLLELPVRDATSGLKATRLSGPGEQLPLSPGALLTNAYAYKLQFLYMLVCAGARFAEIPIVFRLRTHDASKSSWRDTFDTFRVSALLRLRSLRQWRFLRVLAIGGIGFLIQAVLFELIGIRLHLLTPGATVVLVAIIAIFTNFFLHERFSFGDRQGREQSLLRRLVRFFVLTLFGSILIQWLMVHAASVLTGDDPTMLRIAYVLGVGLGLIVGYAGYYFWVWGTGKYRPPFAAGASQAE